MIAAPGSPAGLALRLAATAAAEVERICAAMDASGYSALRGSAAMVRFRPNQR